MAFIKHNSNDTISLDGIFSLNGSAIVKADGTEAFSANQSMGGFRLTNLGTPLVGTDGTNKDYVDNFVLGLSWKTACRASTIANIALSGLLVIDGVTLVADDRVLVKDQTLSKDNGIYVAAAGAWTRSTDANTSVKLESATVAIEEGLINSDSRWTQTNDNFILGTDPVTWVFIGKGAGVVAATFVVSPTPNVGDYTDIQSALDALPVTGGLIFVREGAYTAPAVGGYVMPNKDVEIICAGRGVTTITRVGAGSLFSFGFDRSYRFAGFTVLGDHGVTDQRAFVRTGAASAKRVKIENVNIGSTLVSADGVMVVLDSGGFQTNWDVSDCDFHLPEFPVSPSMIIGTALDNILLTNLRTAGRTSILGSPILTATGFVMTALIVGGLPTFTIGGGSKFVSCVFLQSFPTSTFGTFCLFANSIICPAGSFTVGADSSFVGCELGSVFAAGSRVRISGCSYLSFSPSVPSSGHVLSGNRGSVVVTLTFATDCIIAGHAGAMTYSEPAGAARNRLSDIDFATLPVTLAADTIIEGSKKTGVTAGVTSASFVTVAGFPVVNPKGFFGIGTIKNTGGVNSMNVRETVTDAFGVTTSVTTLVAFGNDYMLDPQTNIDTARPPYLSYLVEVQQIVAATTYDLQFMTNGAVYV